MVFKFLYQVIKMFISAVNLTYFGSQFKVAIRGAVIVLSARHKSIYTDGRAEERPQHKTVQTASLHQDI